MKTHITLRQMGYFVALTKELHFGRAAERLHISQPPLSRQIRQLEQDLGVDLFLRTPSGVELTPAGTAFLPEVKRTLAQADKAVMAARAVRTAQGGQFVVGYTTVFDSSAIPNVVERLRQGFPDYRIVTQGKHSVHLVRDIKRGAMDAAFIGLHTAAEGLTVETIFQEPLLVALPVNHPLASKRSLGFAELQGECLFWFERRLNPGFYDYCQAFFERINFKPKMIPEPPDHHILLGLIAEGKGIALMSASLRHIKRQGVVFRPLKKVAAALSMGITVAYRADNPSPVLQALLALLREEVPPMKSAPDIAIATKRR